MNLRELIDRPFQIQPHCRCGDPSVPGIMHATDVPCMWPEDLADYMARGRWEKALPWMSWEDGWGNYPLWSRCGPKGTPPYDEVALSCNPSRWTLGVEYAHDGDTRSLALQLGPFQLWAGRTGR